MEYYGLPEVSSFNIERTNENKIKLSLMFSKLPDIDREYFQFAIGISTIRTGRAAAEIMTIQTRELPTETADLYSISDETIEFQISHYSSQYQIIIGLVQKYDNFDYLKTELLANEFMQAVIPDGK
jgi:hypothetical protein